MRQFLAGSAAVALAVALSSPASAQDTTSAIRGTVTANGTPVAGASVTVTHVPSGTRTTSTTDASGTFSAAGIRSGGPYSVAVVASGYADSTVNDIETVASQAFELPVELQPVGKDIVVTASRVGNARLIAPGPTTVLTTRQIANVATVNRDIRDLERRDPFARLDDTPSGGRAVSFAGQNARFNRFSVDGVPITDNFGLNPDGLPSRRSPIPLDAIGQFQAKVAPYDVREGNFQGGAINIILRSGTNKFQGTGFYAYQGDGLTGDRTKGYAGNPSGRINIPNFHTDNYGAELSGPIIKDRVFFMIAGERLRGGIPLQEGPVDNNTGIPITNLTQAQVDQVSQIASTRYGYDTGGVLRTSGDKDDRVVGKIDANITDEQRLSLTGTYAKDSININSSNTFTTSPTGLSLASNSYIQGNELYTGVAQLNSKWSDSFSTEARGFYKHYKRLQDPLLGRGFAQMQVCTAPTSDRLVNGVANTNTGASTTCAAGSSTVSFGPDISRQTNQLTTETWGGLLQARLTRDNHDLRLFTEYQRTKVFNSFLQRSSGDYYFDSIADFQAGNAQRFRYGNAVPSLVPDEAAANFRYQAYTFGVQDTWRLADNLTFNYGARYDLYGGHSEAAFARPFFNRYGFANNAYLNGRGILQPRLALDYKPLPRIQLRAGGGIFSGGAPDVYVSNSFSNTGVLTNSIDVRQENSGLFSGTGVNAGNGATILTGVNGTAIPGAANTLLTNATVSSTSTTNALDPNFKIPSQWRATVSADYRANLGPLGDGWDFGADLLYSAVRNQVLFTDIRSVPIAGSLTPDGRQRYQSRTSFTDTNSDILLTNTNKGRSLVAVARFDKSWDFGLNLNGSFTYQDVKDQAPATSSTAGSNYANGAFLDPNVVQYGRSNDEVRYFFKYSATFDHAFFGDYKTTIALFGESRIGRPYSYTFQDNASARSAVFGTIGSNSRYLLYVPTFGGDSKVSYANATQQSQIEDYFRRTGLGKYQGRTSKRNAFNSPWFTRLDLHLAQEVPTGLGRSRLTAFADIENFTNLLNRKWGQISEYAFPYNVAPVRVSCLVAPSGAAAANSSQPCAQYRYTPSITDANGNFVDPNRTVYGRQSLFVIRVGARFTF